MLGGIFTEVTEVVVKGDFFTIYCTNKLFQINTIRFKKLLLNNRSSSDKNQKASFLFTFFIFCIWQHQNKETPSCLSKFCNKGLRPTAHCTCCSFTQSKRLTLKLQQPCAQKLSKVAPKRQLH